MIEIERSAEDGLPLTLKKADAPAYDARFVLSAATPDRVKDTIDPKAYLPNLSKKLIALWAHEREDPSKVLGYWANLKVIGDALVGDIKFTANAAGQIVKTLIAEEVPLMASIGFRGKGEHKKDGGVHFTALEIFETSIVPVGAHPRALQVMKQFGFPSSAAGHVPARAHSSSSPSSARAESSRSKSMTKTIAELVVDTQTEQVALVDKLAAESAKLGALQTDTDEFTTQKALVDGIDVQLKAVDGKLASLKSAEARLAKGAPAADDAASIASAAILKARGGSKDTDRLLGKLALCVFESRVKSMPIAQVAAERFPQSQAVEVMIKAAQNPAMTNVAGYAQELTRQAYGQLMEMLREEALLPRLIPAAQSHSFEGGTPIVIPMRAGTLTDAAGAFRAEGAPIPVKGLQFTSQSLTPKNMGVILTATEEMLRRSSIDLAAYFESAMRQDTAHALDLLFLSDTAGTATAPAGSRDGLTAADTRASTGATAAQITNDLKVMLKALTSAQMGSSNTRWLMHPANLVHLSMILTATGSKQFPETDAGRLAGYPVVTSIHVPDDIILLIDFAQYSFAIGNPNFLATNVATLHEEDTTPLAISSPGTPNVVAAPVRSLYQTYSWALRMILDADWAKMRTPGPVQELTAVAW